MLRRIIGGCVAVILGITGMALLPSPAIAAEPMHGIQFGQPINLNNCARNGPVSLLLNNPSLLARTSWLRIDLRAGGGSDVAVCSGVDQAYKSILDELYSKAPQIKVIGLISNEFIYGSDWHTNQAAYADRLATAAGNAACSLNYTHVTTWEVWNEPDVQATFLDPSMYARFLGRASRQIHNCGDSVISGGVANGTTTYLSNVDSAMRASLFGGYASLAAAVNGIGIHPYVTPIAIGASGHAPLNTFLSTFAAFGLPMYLTEFGWQVNSGTNEAKQCYNIVHAYGLMAGSYQGRVAAGVWFTLQDFGDNTRNYGLYDVASTQRPAATGYINDRCPPMQPANAVATTLDRQSIRVTWTDRSTNETGFKIYDGVGYTTVAANTTTYTRTGLADGKYMCFAVFATNADGDSPWTPYACSTTTMVTPTNVRITNVTSSTITVAWTDNANGEKGFRVYDGVNFFTVGANVTAFTRTGLASHTYMCFAVQAFNDGQSGWSPYACTSTL